jgi:hypothetical protein
MPHLPPLPSAPDPNLPMRGPFATSFMLHGAVFLAINALAWANSRSVQKQAHEFVERIAKQEQRDAERAKKSERAAAAESARARLAMEMADLVSADGRSPEAEQLIAEANDSLSELFNDEGAPQGEQDFEAERMAALAAVQADADKLMREQLVAQVRQYVRDEVAPEINERIEHELKDQAGAALQRDLEQGLRDDKANRLRKAAGELRKRADELGKVGQEVQQAKQEVQQGKSADAAGVAAKARDTAVAGEPETAAAARAAAAEDPNSKEAIAAADGAPMKAALDKGAATATGEQKAATDALDQAAGAVENRRQQLAKAAQELESHAGDAGFDDVQRAQAAAAKDRIDPKLRERIAQAVRDQAIPEAANKIADAVGRELEQAGIQRGQFEKLVKEDINKALTEGTGASSDGAWTRVDSSLGADDGAGLKQARDAASSAAKKLAQLADRQDQVRGDATDQAGRETTLAKDISSAEGAAQDALAQARAETLGADAHIDQSTQNLRARTASSAATEAAAAATANDKPKADERMQATSQSLRSSADQLGQVASALDQEAAARAAAAHPPKGHDGRAADALAAKAMPGALDAAARSVGAAAAQFQPGKVLGDAAGLARLKQLQESLAQAKKNASEGRALGNPALFGPGAGAGAAVGPMVGKGHSRAKLSSFNRAAYEAFVKDLHERTNPGNAYEPVAEVDGLDSVAEAEHGPFPSAVWAEPHPAEPAKSAPAAERTVVEPTFKHVAFGAAAMMEHPITIDGDLSDWGELTHPMAMQFHSDGSPLQDGPKMYMRWSNQGLYFAYTVKDDTGIQPSVTHPYLGDCLEVWLDMENARRELMAKSQYTHQFCFDPFGYNNDPACTFVEIGRDQRGLKMYQCYPDATGKRAKCAAKLVPGGYSVECFLARETLSKPVLVPGAYLALNFSISVDNDPSHEMQWSAAKSMETWNRPDTWGDVLLLGADATVKVQAMDGSTLERVVPGQAVQVEISDADMNMDPAHEDRVMASVGVKDGGEPVLIVLKETGPDTGVFRGSVNTQFYLDEPRKNCVPVRPGDTLQVSYDDPRAAYGEQHRRVSVELPVAHPVIKLAAMR